MIGPSLMQAVVEFCIFDFNGNMNTVHVYFYHYLVVLLYYAEWLLYEYNGIFYTAWRN